MFSNLFSKIIAFFMSLLASLFGVTGFTVGERAAALRVTAYLVVSTAEQMKAVDASHFADITDIILFSAASFDAEGKIALSPDLGRMVEILRQKTGENDPRIHLNFFGPGAVEGETWEEQMRSQAEQLKKAFDSGILEAGIKDVLEEYGFNGFAFDYEYPIEKAHRENFGNFILSLDKTLGDDYSIVCAMMPFAAEYPRRVIRAIDMVELMCYDVWESDGTHSSLENAQGLVRDMLKLGYKRAQIDMGIPFYARPTTHDAVWYDYANYWDKIDENGFAPDEANGLVASFNTPELVYEKTAWAIRQGLGGVMVWHYRCDVPADNDMSLFRAIARAKKDGMAAKPFGTDSRLI